MQRAPHGWGRRYIYGPAMHSCAGPAADAATCAEVMTPACLLCTLRAVFVPLVYVGLSDCGWVLGWGCDAPAAWGTRSCQPGGVLGPAL